MSASLQRAGLAGVYARFSAGADSIHAFAGDPLFFPILNSTHDPCNTWEIDLEPASPSATTWLQAGPIAQAANATSQPFFAYENKMTRQDPVGFTPPTGVLEKLLWDCGEGVRVREKNGTIHTYQNFFKRNETHLGCVTGGGGTLPHGGRGLESLPGSDADMVRVQMLSRRIVTEFPDGNLIKYKYDTWGRLVEVEDTMGRSITLSQGTGAFDFGVALEITDWTGRKASLEFQDVTGNGVPFLTRVTTPAVTLGPSQKDNSYPNGKIWDFEYDITSELITNNYRGASGPEYRHYLNSFKIRDPKSQGGYAYLEANLGATGSGGWRVNSIRSGLPDATNFPSGGWTYYDWDIPSDWCADLGNPEVTVTDPNGFEMRFVFDRFGNQIEQWDLRDPQNTSDDILVGRRNFKSDPSHAYPNPFGLVFETDTESERFVEELEYRFQHYFSSGQDLLTFDTFQLGNIVQRTIWPQTSGQEIIETTRFDPVFNQAWQKTDPLGRMTESVIDYMEGHSIHISDLVNEWGIDLSDMDPQADWGRTGNGDSEYTQQGFVVQTIHPTVTVGLAASPIQDASEIFFYNQHGALKRTVDSEGYATEFTYYPESDPYGGNASIPRTSDGGGYLAEQTAYLDKQPDSNPLTTTYYRYDPFGNAEVVVSPKGSVTYRDYNEREQVYREVIGDVSMTGVPGTDASETLYLYDLNDNIAERWRRTDNPDLLPIAEWFEDRFTYDALDNLRKEELHLVDPTASAQNQSRWVERYWDYDPNGNLVGKVEQKESVGGSPVFVATSTVYTYQNKVSEFRQHVNVDTDPADGLPPANSSEDFWLKFEYDDDQNITRTEDSEGAIWFLDYDDFQRRLRSRNLQEGITKEHEFDAASQIVRATISGPPRPGLGVAEADLSESIYEYDERGRLFETRTAFYSVDESTGDRIPLASGTARVQLEFDRRGLTVAEVDALGRRTETEFDGLGREIEKRLPLVTGMTQSNRVETDYDANSNVSETRSYEYGLEPSGTEFGEVYTIRSTYDLQNRELTRIVEPDDSSLAAKTTFWYDSLGNVTRERNPNKEGYAGGGEEGIGFSYVHDSFGRLQSSRFGYASWTMAGVIPGTSDGFIDKAMAYDDRDALTTETDDLGKTTTYEYDNLNRRTRTVFADGSSELSELRTDGLVGRRLAYDGASPTPSLQFAVDYDYDSIKRLATEDVTYAGAGYLGWRYRWYLHDGLDRVVKTQSASINPLVPQDDHITTTERWFDSIGNLLSERQTLESGTQVLSDAMVTSEYDEASNRLELASGTGYQYSFAYDELNRLSEISDPPSVPAPRTYAKYSYVGPSSRTTRCEHPFNGTDSIRGSAAWDGRRRPMQITHRQDNGGSWSTLWEVMHTYSRTSNRLSDTKTHDPGKNRTYVYDPADRLESVAGYHPESFTLDGAGNWSEHSYDGGPTHSNTTGDMHEYSGSFDGNTVAHDSRGNTTQYGNTAFVYDIDGRVVGATSAGNSWIYVHDPDGRRVARQTISGGISWTHFIYDKEQEILEESGATTRSLVWDMSGSPALFVTNGTPYGVHLDALGSVVALTNGAGALSESFDYDPYGAHEATDHDGGGLSGLAHLWTGKRFDAETDTYYFQRRSYSPEMGRFLSRDPIGIWGDPSTRGNGYGYGPSNPYAGTDPDGALFDLIVDVVSVGVSAYEFVKEPSLGNAAALLADVGGAVIPGVPSPGSVKLGAKLLDKASDVFKGGDKANDARKAADRGSDAANVGDRSRDVANNADRGRSSSRGNDAAGTKPGGDGCFVAGTLIWTINGRRVIESIRVGDAVLTPETADHEGQEGSIGEDEGPEDDEQPWIVARFEVPGAGPRIREITLLRPRQWLGSLEAGETRHFALDEAGWSGLATLVGVETVNTPRAERGRLVTGTFVGESSDVVEVRLEGSLTPTRATATHPFFVTGRGWVSAGCLQGGDAIPTPLGNQVCVVSVLPVPGLHRIFNLEVKREHVYYVGDVGALVHNQCPKRQGSGGTETPHTVDTSRPPNNGRTGEPNSIHEQVGDDGRTKSVTYFDENGRRFSREDLGGQKKGHGILDKDTPHEHRWLYNEDGKPIGKQYRELDKNGKPVGGWIDD